MSGNQKNKELNDILEFNGNEEEFKKYNNLLKKPFYSHTIYYDKEKKQKKYIGNLIKNIYEGRGISYDTSGILKNGNPENTKSVPIYDNDEYLLYIGDFDSFKYHGEGTLYFEKKNKVFFKGQFCQGEFENGLLYYPYGNF